MNDVEAMSFIDEAFDQLLVDLVDRLNSEQMPYPPSMRDMFGWLGYHVPAEPERVRMNAFGGLLATALQRLSFEVEPLHAELPPWEPPVYDMVTEAGIAAMKVHYDEWLDRILPRVAYDRQTTKTLLIVLNQVFEDEENRLVEFASLLSVAFLRFVAEEGSTDDD